MNALHTLERQFAHVDVERIGWMLVHSLWELAVAGLIAQLALLVLRRSPAAVRYGVLVVVMTVAAAAPVGTWFLVRGAGPDGAGMRGARPSEATPRSSSRTSVALGDSQAGARGVRSASDARNVGARAGLGEALRTAQRTRSAASVAAACQRTLRRWLGWLVAGWSGGVVLFSLRLLLGWRMLRKLQRNGVVPMPAEVTDVLRRLSERLGLRRAVTSVQSSIAQVPMVVGYLRPMILLPVSLLSSIPVTQLEAILAHELAHVRRHDFVVNVLQTLAETLFFYHPAVWWLSRRIRIEREHCCDDLVVAVLDNRLEYGRALLAVEELRGRRSVLALAVTDGSLLARVRRILAVRPDLIEGRTGRGSLLPLALAGIGLALFVALSYSLARDDAKASPERTVARLPGGITVELVGVGFHPSKGRDWWTPDGRPLLRKLPLEGGVSVMPNSPSQAQCREFYLEIRGLPREHAVATKYGVSSASASGSKFGDGLWVSEDAAGPFDSQPTSIGIALTTEPFGPVVSIDVHGRKLGSENLPEALRPLYDLLVPVRVGEMEGQSNLVLKGPPLDELHRRADLEIHAVDLDGQIHRRTSEWAPPTGVKHDGFSLPLNRVARFEYRLRPYGHHITFANVSLQPGARTEVAISVESPSPPKAEHRPDSAAHRQGRFLPPVRLHLSAEKANGERWYFVDLDRGDLLKPPFAVELARDRLPWTVIRPEADRLERWLVENGADLILFVEGNRVQTWAIRTVVDSVNGLLETPHVDGTAWRWKNTPEPVLNVFRRRDDATHVSGFVPHADGGVDVRPDQPLARAFRTAQNVVGFALLEPGDPTSGAIDMQLVRIADATVPLNDLDLDGRFVDGKDGPANPPRTVRPLRATLREGQSVELVGITKNTEPASTGWRPGGGDLNAVPEWPAGETLSGGNTMSRADPRKVPPDTNARDFLIEFRGLREQPSFWFDLPGGSAGYSHDPVKDPYRLRVSGWLRGQPGSPYAELGPPAGVVRVRMTDEPWGKWLQVSPAGEVLNPPAATDRYHSMYDRVVVDRIASYDRAPNKSVLVLRPPKDALQLFSFEIRAIDTDGQKHWVLQWEGRPATDVAPREEKWSLAQPLPAGKQLARYEFRLRPYRDLVTFRNVALRSDVETDPKVDVQPLSAAGIGEETASGTPGK